MGIALLAIVDLWTPLQSLASRLLPVRNVHRRSARAASTGSHSLVGRPAGTARPCGQAAANAVAAPARPLRVIRVVDQPGEKRSANRMVISGRMADVCAELDRLAALEAMESVHTAPRSAQLH
jgi:hypothetical protein